MTGRGARTPDAAGGPARHVPVLAREVVDALAPGDARIYCDGTFGAGGYSRAILDAAPGCRVLAIDRDPEAIAGGAALVVDAGGRRWTPVDAGVDAGGRWCGGGWTQGGHRRTPVDAGGCWGGRWGTLGWTRVDAGG